MSEPFFVRQAAEIPLDARSGWFQRTVDDACREGATFVRFSVHDKIADLCLLEGWRERPDDQGDQRFQLTALSEAD